MTLYLDNSFLNRSFDNLDIKMNKLEAEILFVIIDLAEKGKVELVDSSIIEYENSLNPFPERKAFVDKILTQAKTYQNLNQEIEKIAKDLIEELQLDSIDSLHLATAQHSKVDLFITSDYNLVKKYKGSLKVIKPTDFLKYYENPSN